MVGPVYDDRLNWWDLTISNVDMWSHAPFVLRWTGPQILVSTWESLVTNFYFTALMAL